MFELHVVMYGKGTRIKYPVCSRVQARRPISRSRLILSARRRRATLVISIMAGTSCSRDLCLCRVCYTESDSKHCTRLFTDSDNQALTCRISELLQISIEEGDGLPTMICRSCLGKFKTIESKIDNLRVLAHSNCLAYLKSHTSVCTHKRPKSTSGIGVSPTTSQVQPLPKRFQGDHLGKKLCFDQRGM